MNDHLVNRQYLSYLLGIDGDGSLCNSQSLGVAVAELQFALDLVRTQEVTIRIKALDERDARRALEGTDE